MIIDGLYKNPTVLDRVQHRSLRLKHPFNDYSRMAQTNSLFAAVAEFADLCREYPLVFVAAGKDQESGEDLFAPMAVMGLKQGENLYVQPGGRWRTPYIPALLRRYPFAMAQVGNDQMAICLDRDYDGWSETEGQPLFQDDGQPTEMLKNIQQFVQNFEEEVQRTRSFCSTLNREGLLQGMRFDAKLPDGSDLSVDGFFVVDDKKLAELPDAKVVELHRSGVLGLVNAHQISMGLMRRLVEWHVERKAAQH